MNNIKKWLNNYSNFFINSYKNKICKKKKIATMDKMYKLPLEDERVEEAGFVVK